MLWEVVCIIRLGCRPLFYWVSYFQTYMNEGGMNAVLLLSKVGYSSERVIKVFRKSLQDLP